MSSPSSIALTHPDKIFLESKGHSHADIVEIIHCLKHTVYSLVTDDGTTLTIDAKEAIERLGRDEWLKGIARSSFYCETTRIGLSGEKVHIRTKNWA